MKKWREFFYLTSLVAILLPSATYALDPSGISNPNGWQQTTHTATLTVADDGTSLLYRKKDTGMSLNTPVAANSKVKLVDESIAPQAPRGAAAVAAGAGATTAGRTGTSGATTGTAPTTQPSATTPSNPTSTPNNSTTNNSGLKQTAGKVAKGAGAVVGTAVGGYMIYDATTGKEKHTAGNLVEGVLGGVTAGAAIGTVAGSPGIGTAIGAVVGGAIAGSQLFSETDCLTDPETGVFTCCHTAFNKGKRQADIGDYMFCANEEGKSVKGSVRQCQQGKSATKDTWWKGLWKDDAWTPDCIRRLCSGEIEPSNGMSYYIDYQADTQNYCWKWNCINGYVKSGDICIPAENGTYPIDPYDIAIQRINEIRQKIIAECGNM